MKKTAVFLLTLLFFQACSIHHVKKQDPKPLFIFIKSDMIKANNQAFLYRDKIGLEAEFYELGSPFLKLSLGERICINKSCYSKNAFNKRFFKAKYYPDLIEDIMSFKPIFNGKNLEKTDCGFSQSLGSISYSYCSGELRFIDGKKIKIIINEGK